MAAGQPPNFDRFPVTFGGYISEQVRSWEELFPAERDYFTRLAALLERAPREFFDPLLAIETQMGVNAKNWPRGTFSLEQVDFLNRNAHYPAWRAEISRIFSVLDPQLDEEIRRKGRPRLIVVMSPADLPVGPDRLWLRLASYGKRVKIEAPENAAALLVEDGKSLLDLTAEQAGPYEAWSIEAGNRIATVSKNPRAVRLSYQNLEAYRLRLMGEVRRVTESESIQGPRQLGARLKGLKLRESESEFSSDEPLNEFVRATLLNGNGTLLVNNTFVEWASAQAIRRAKPTLLYAGFGIRNKVKPFSSLLIYSDPEKANQIPTQADMLGSYVDLEILYQYIWREHLKFVEYKNNTALLFAAEGVDEALLIAPPDFPGWPADTEATLPQLRAALRKWLFPALGR
jgi:hypothetical protein